MSYADMYKGKRNIHADKNKILFADWSQGSYFDSLNKTLALCEPIRQNQEVLKCKN